MSSGIVLHLLAALTYLVLALALWRPLWRRQAPGAGGLTSGMALALALLLHGAALHQTLMPAGSLELGWASALSAAIWLGMLVYGLENLVMPIGSLQLILLPAAALAALLAAVFPDTRVVVHADAGWLRTHLIIALTAYGLITVAALHAMFMAALDRQLHRPVGHDGGLMSRALDALPPLLVQEILLFRLVWVGFAVLTLTVITGAMVSLRLNGVAFPIDHKTLFTVLSWLTFGGLLMGRHTRGWRGRQALRWTLTGFAFLLLAYTGTRFVLEVILS